jgi:5-aminopentanamidase
MGFSSPKREVAMKRTLLGLVIVLVGCSAPPASPGPQEPGPRKGKIRVGSLQPRSRLIDWRLTSPEEVLARVDRNLSELSELVHRAGKAGSDVVTLPEDTLGLGTWEAANEALLPRVLPEAVRRMLQRLGAAAASHSMYLVVCNDTVDADGSVRNTAFFLGRDGQKIGVYHKVNMPIHELTKKRGGGFPVFPTPDLGTVGLLICYDMVFPEAARCLALGGADIIFHPTLGGAAMADGEVSRAAFRTRAAENFVYIVVSQRGAGSMVISPRGEILGEAKGEDGLVVAEIDPSAGREGGDALNHQRDMRARLFRERSPEAYGILVDPRPPVLAKVPEAITVAEATRIGAKALTVGEVEFHAADTLAREGRSREALVAYEKLATDYPGTWIERVSRERAAKIGRQETASEPERR